MDTISSDMLFPAYSPVFQSWHDGASRRGPVAPLQHLIQTFRRNKLPSAAYLPRYPLNVAGEAGATQFEYSVFGNSCLSNYNSGTSRREKPARNLDHIL